MMPKYAHDRIRIDSVELDKLELSYGAIGWRVTHRDIAGL